MFKKKEVIVEKAENEPEKDPIYYSIIKYRNMWDLVLEHITKKYAHVKRPTHVYVDEVIFNLIVFCYNIENTNNPYHKYLDYKCNSLEIVTSSSYIVLKPIAPKPIKTKHSKKSK